MKSVRLWFEKSGLAIYISHLDMNRCMMRAVRRANIPLWYTEGFNPHPYLTFLMPLPLGQEGRREPLDIKIDGDMDNSQIMDRLNAVLPGGIRIIEASEPVCSGAQIDSAVYDIKAVFETVEQAAEFCEAARGILEGGVLNAQKRSKKGMTSVNLCPLTRSFVTAPCLNAADITAVLAAGNTSNLNCDLLMNTLYTETGLKPIITRCVRTKLLKENGEEFI